MFSITFTEVGGGVGGLIVPLLPDDGGVVEGGVVLGGVGLGGVETGGATLLII